MGCPRRRAVTAVAHPWGMCLGGPARDAKFTATDQTRPGKLGGAGVANCARRIAPRNHPPPLEPAAARLIKDPFLAPQGESAGFAFTKDEMLEIFKAKTDAFKAADYEESGFTHEKNATTPEYARRSPSRHPPRTALTAHRSRLRSAGSSRR